MLCVLTQKMISFTSLFGKNVLPRQKAQMNFSGLGFYRTAVPQRIRQMGKCVRSQGYVKYQDSYTSDSSCTSI
jgi:hypothetical protein